MRYKKLLIILLAFAGMQASAQDLAHYKRVIKELSSAKYQGRGYAKNGANKAGIFLEKEYQKAGVDGVTLQPFKLDINTFPGKMDVSVILNSQLAQNAPSIFKEPLSVLRQTPVCCREESVLRLHARRMPASRGCGSGT